MWVCLKWRCSWFFGFRQLIEKNSKNDIPVAPHCLHFTEISLAIERSLVHTKVKSIRIVCMWKHDIPKYTRYPDNYILHYPKGYWYSCLFEIYVHRCSVDVSRLKSLSFSVWRDHLSRQFITFFKTNSGKTIAFCECGFWISKQRMEFFVCIHHTCNTDFIHTYASIGAWNSRM